MDLLKGLVDDKLLRMLKLFLDDKTRYFHLTELASKSKVPASSAHRLIKQLVVLGFVMYDKLGKLKIYKYNDSEKSRKLEEVLKQ